MSDRDKFLTEAMGGASAMCCVVGGDTDIDQTCVRQDDYDGYRSECIHGEKGEKPEECEFWKSRLVDGIDDFSTWQGFGKLWEWAVDQEWWEKFQWEPTMTPKGVDMFGGTLSEILNNLIHPDRFATAIYDYLKPKETP